MCQHSCTKVGAHNASRCPEPPSFLSTLHCFDFWNSYSVFEIHICNISFFLLSRRDALYTLGKCELSALSARSDGLDPEPRLDQTDMLIPFLASCGFPGVVELKQSYIRKKWLLLLSFGASIATTIFLMYNQAEHFFKNCIGKLPDHYNTAGSFN